MSIITLLFTYYCICNFSNYCSIIILTILNMVVSISSYSISVTSIIVLELVLTKISIRISNISVLII